MGKCQDWNSSKEKSDRGDPHVLQIGMHGMDDEGGELLAGRGRVASGRRDELQA